MKNYISRYYQITKTEYFLGIENETVFETNDKRYASLFVIVGKRIELGLKPPQKNHDDINKSINNQPGMQREFCAFTYEL